MSDCAYCGQRFPEDEVPIHFIREFRDDMGPRRCFGSPERKEIKLGENRGVSAEAGVQEDEDFPVHLL